MYIPSDLPMLLSADRPHQDSRAQGAQEGRHGAHRRGVQPHALVRLGGREEVQKDV